MRFYTLICRGYLNTQSGPNDIKKASNSVVGVSVIAYAVIDHDLFLCIVSQLSDEDVASSIGELIGSFKNITVDEVRTGWPLNNQAISINDYYFADKLNYLPIEGSINEFNHALVSIVFTLISIFGVVLVLYVLHATFNAFLVIILALVAMAYYLIIFTQSVQQLQAGESELDVKLAFGATKSLKWEDIDAIEVFEIPSSKGFINLRLTTRMGLESFKIFDWRGSGTDRAIFKTIGYRAGLVVLEILGRNLRLGKPEKWEIVIEK